MTNQIYKCTATMYYDHYEKEFGDGFYPLCESKDLLGYTMSKTNITFALNQNGVWTQINNDNIYGLDGDHGKLLLDILNQEIKFGESQSIDGFKQGHCIYNSIGKCIYPK